MPSRESKLGMTRNVSRRIKHSLFLFQDYSTREKKGMREREQRNSLLNTKKYCIAFFERVNGMPSVPFPQNLMLDLSGRKGSAPFAFSQIYNGRCETYGTKQSDLRISKCNIATCCFDTPIDMILLAVPVTACARRELSPFLQPLSSLVSLFFVICTPNRAELLQHRGTTTAAAPAAAENLK